MSPTTPTTVIDAGPNGRDRLPTGSPSNNAVTRSLTRATAGVPVPIGEPATAKKRHAERVQVVRRHIPNDGALEPSPGRAALYDDRSAPIRTVYGRNVVKPADTTPGRRPTVEHLAVERILALRCRIVSRGQRDVGGQDVVTRNPGSTACRLRMVRIISPVEKSTTTASATSGHERPARRRPVAVPVVRVFSGVRKIHPQRVSQRHETEHEPREQDGDEGHRQQPQVQRRGDGAAQGIRDQRLQHVERPRGQQQCDGSTGGGQQQPSTSS